MSASKGSQELRDGEVVRRGAYPEFTWTAISVGWMIGILIAISISYAALKLGFSIEGSELAAILGWGILRGMMGRTSILENNINQTIASAVNGASSGIMFSVPALFILSKTPGLEAVREFDVPLMIFACIAGAFIGLAFVIPLRKQMIDFQRLPYPGGIAVAAILKSPGAGIQKSILLFGAALFAGIVYFFITCGVEPLSKDPIAVQTGFHIGQNVYTIGAVEHVQYDMGKRFELPPRYNLIWFGSLMTIGVGFLSGKGGFWFGAGGFICYWLLSPLLSMYGAPEVQTMVELPDSMRRFVYRPTGIGAAIGGILTAFPLIWSAINSLRKSKSTSGSDAGDDELPFRWLASAVVLGALLLVFLAYRSVDAMPLGTAIAMAILGTLWIWIAGVIVAECIGRTNWSPLSGMTLIAVTILIMIAKRQLDNPQTIVVSMVVGAAICLAISQASDMMLDLKSGYLVGAIPKRQQLAQFVGAWLGPILVIGLMFLLERGATPVEIFEGGDSAIAAAAAATSDGEIAYGIGSEKYPAAQASALASVIKAIVDGNVPTYRYVAGSGLGFLLAASGLGGIGVMVALGFYMPFDIVLTYTMGCLLRVICNRFAGEAFSENKGIPMAAGLIVGEALVGVGIAIYNIFGS